VPGTLFSILLESGGVFVLHATTLDIALLHIYTCIYILYIRRHVCTVHIYVCRYRYVLCYYSTYSMCTVYCVLGHSAKFRDLEFLCLGEMSLYDYCDSVK
jgi:hypothetical protein